MNWRLGPSAEADGNELKMMFKIYGRSAFLEHMAAFKLTSVKAGGKELDKGPRTYRGASFQESFFILAHKFIAVPFKGRIMSNY